jgi:hypothetical protein
MKKLFALGLVCALPTGLAAEDPNELFNDALLGTTNVLVIEDATALAKDVVCVRAVAEQTECMAFNRAVLTAHIKKVSALRERGRWM